jgi:hypothetical protein
MPDSVHPDRKAERLIKKNCRSSILVQFDRFVPCWSVGLDLISRNILVYLSGFKKTEAEWSTLLVLSGGYASKQKDHMESLFHMVFLFLCPQGGTVYTDNSKSRGGVDCRDSIFGSQIALKLILGLGRPDLSSGFNHSEDI